MSRNGFGRPRGLFAGKIARVDLSTGETTIEDGFGYASRTLGGRGTNSLIMLKEIPFGTKWDDDGNLLCFGAGALVGTPAPGACRTDISSVSVFNGGKGSANVGGSWGAELKYAGFDHLIVRGKAKRPVYLYVEDGTVEIRDASGLWGKTIPETERLLRVELGRRVKIAAIGPAGENRVRGSAVMVDTSKAAGGSGVGCVMGDKKLKAVAVRGNGSVDVFDAPAFVEALDDARRACMASPHAESMRRSAAARFEDVDFEGWDTCLVVRNGQDDFWSKAKRARLMDASTGVPSMRKRVMACPACPIGCMPYMETDQGRYPAMRGEGFWVNAIMSAARLDVSDPESAVKFWLLANELGLDTDYAASMLAWLFECYERGYVSQQDVDGLQLVWGNGEALIEMTRRLAFRQGIGDALADGPIAATSAVGHDSRYYLADVKGQPSIEPFRIPKGWSLAVSTSPVAGRHLRGSVRGPSQFGPDSLRFDTVGYKNQARAVVWQSKTKELEDALGICSFVGTWSGANFLTPRSYAGFIRSGAGLDVTEDDLMDHFAVVGRNLEKAFNTLHTDMSRDDDLPPLRFRAEQVKSGPYVGECIGIDQYQEMLTEFYRLWDWDPKTGMQTPEGLARIGLTDIADLLAKRVPNPA